MNRTAKRGRRIGALLTGMLFCLPASQLPATQDLPGCYPNCNTDTKYPIILSHGWMDNGEPDGDPARPDTKRTYGSDGNKGSEMHGFYTIPETLQAHGLREGWVTVPDKDSFVPLIDDTPDMAPYTRAEQLKMAIMDLIAWTAPHYDPQRGYLDRPGGDLWKVNIIGHCAGGVEARFLASTNSPYTDGWGNPMYKRIASVTSMVSPHAGVIFFDLLDQTVGTNNSLPSWAQSLVDWGWEEIEEIVQNSYGILGPEDNDGAGFRDSMYHETQQYMVDGFADAFQIDPSVYFQGWDSLITNIKVERFKRWKIPFLFTKWFYERYTDEDGDNDSLIHPLSSQGKYVVYKDPKPGQQIGDIVQIAGMDTYNYRGTEKTSFWYAGVSHIYMVDSASTYHTRNSDGSWELNVPKEPQKGWSSKEFYVEVVDDLRRRGY